MEEIMELDLNKPGSIGEKSFNILWEKIKSLAAKNILEFGSGVSSIRMARAFPETNIVSIDHDLKYYRKTHTLKRKYCPGSNLNILFSPLRYQWSSGSLFLSYAKNKFSGIFDCVIIDGPQSWLTLRGREVCLYKVYENLRIGAVVVLDDYSREEEKTVLKNWLLTYPGSFRVDVVEEGHHLVFLTKVKQVKPRYFCWSKFIDNLQTNIHLFLRSFKRRFIPAH